VDSFSDLSLDLAGTRSVPSSGIDMMTEAARGFSVSRTLTFAIANRKSIDGTGFSQASFSQNP
jgi:hypothetical protein